MRKRYITPVEKSKKSQNGDTGKKTKHAYRAS